TGLSGRGNPEGASGRPTGRAGGCRLLTPTPPLSPDQPGERNKAARPRPGAGTRLPPESDAGGAPFWPALAGLLRVALIGWLDSRVGPGLSFFLFYLLPVALAAWCGGFPHGVLLALAGALTWHLVDAAQGAERSLPVQLWNGVLRFGTFVLCASLLA